MRTKFMLALGAACAISPAAYAAQNPFADVPKEHWAYDAVEQLSEDGVIEGYGDDTYRGDRTITRFEMAQLVARAMSKEEAASAQDKALIEKLSREFEGELKNLGLRVEQLEKNADKVIWKGKVRIDYSSPRYEHTPVHGKDYKKNDISTLFRFEPMGIINDHWTVRTRINAYLNYDTDTTTTPQLKRLWAEGKYGDNVYRIGRIPVNLDSDIMFDTQFSGVQVQAGKKTQWIFNAGRFNLNEGNDYFRYANNKSEKDPSNYYAAGFTGNYGKLFVGAAYHYLTNSALAYLPGYGAGKDTLRTATAKGTYHFDKNIAFQVNYGYNFASEDYNNSWSTVVGYKEFENYSAKNVGEWGLYLAYRSIGQNVGPKPTYTMDAGTKGIEAGFIYTIMPNTFFQLKAARGKTLIGNDDYSEYFARFEFHY